MLDIDSDHWAAARSRSSLEWHRSFSSRARAIRNVKSAEDALRYTVCFTWQRWLRLVTQWSTTENRGERKRWRPQHRRYASKNLGGLRADTQRSPKVSLNYCTQYHLQSIIQSSTISFIDVVGALNEEFDGGINEKISCTGERCRIDSFIAAAGE